MEHDKEQHQALEKDATYVHSYHLRALARFGAGDHRGALDDLNKALKLEPTQLDCRHMRGVVQHGLGLLKAAVADYDAVIVVKADHVAWYQKEVALFVHSHFDTPLSDFNIDVAMDKYFKESWCKRNHPAILGNCFLCQRMMLIWCCSEISTATCNIFFYSRWNIV